MVFTNYLESETDDSDALNSIKFHLTLEYRDTLKKHFSIFQDSNQGEVAKD